MPEALYVDFDDRFEPHPVTGDLPLLKDVSAIKRQIYHLILTDFYERPFNPTVGTQTKRTLFEFLTDDVKLILEQNIIQSIENSVPCAVNEVTATDDGNYTVRVLINFTLLNNDTAEEMVVLLDRVQ